MSVHSTQKLTDWLTEALVSVTVLKLFKKNQRLISG